MLHSHRCHDLKDYDLKRIQEFGLVGPALIVCLLVVGFLVRFATRTIPTKSTMNSCVQLRTDLERLSCGGTVANDWGELAQYRNANAGVGPVIPGVSRVVFIGDSITFNWPGLGAKNHFPGMEVISRGIAGQLTAQMLLRFRQDVVDLQPRVVVILGGSNDIERVMPPTLPVIEGNLASMTQLARTNGIHVVLSSIPPVHDSGHDEKGESSIRTRTHPPERIRELNEWLKRFAKQQDCVYLDYYSSLVDDQGFLKREYSDDGLHPNVAGYAVMEPLVLQAIKEATR
jgi:lysophospholipase L1-like esterase